MTPRHRASGQALVELAIFGSFIIMLLSVLLNYGLNYDYQQQATMAAFRQGLETAAKSSDPDAPVSTVHLLIQDRHIPNPTNPFGVGAVVPAAGVGAVTRNYELQLVPQDDESLPRLAIQIQGAECPAGARKDASTNPPTCSYTLAGFRTDPDVSLKGLERYEFVYGETNVCDEPKCGGGFEGCPDGVYTEETNPLDPYGGPQQVCVNPVRTVRVMDTCEGQIISYDDCLRQAAQLVDSGVCRDACVKAGKTVAKCEEMCSRPVAKPWYAQGAFCSGGRCTAPALDAMFAGARALGVQPTITQVRRQDLQLVKRETASGITTTDSGSWSEGITRPVVTHEGDGARREEAVTAVTGQTLNASQSVSW